MFAETAAMSSRPRPSTSLDTPIGGSRMLPEFPSAYQRWAGAREGASGQKPAHNEFAAWRAPPAHLVNESLSDSSVEDTLERNLRTQWSPFEEAQLGSALAYISAVSRGKWLCVGLAIHYEGWGPGGKQIWCDWSQTAPEKYDEADQERTWKSFDRPYRGTADHLAINIPYGLSGRMEGVPTILLGTKCGGPRKKSGGPRS
jgi:hypothetical protein